MNPIVYDRHGFLIVRGPRGDYHVVRTKWQQGQASLAEARRTIAANLLARRQAKGGAR
jgi:hypothetical protein